MSHKYSSFAAAFEHLTFHDWHIRTSIQNAYNSYYAAVTYANEGNWKQGIIAAGGAGYEAAKALEYLIDMTYTEVDESHFFESLYWAYKDTVEIEISMSDIITAMLRAEPDDVMRFVGIVDAYRVSVWDRPFNEPLYAAMAEGFKIWP